MRYYDAILGLYPDVCFPRPLLTNGKERVPNQGNDYSGARDYSSSMGRVHVAGLGLKAKADAHTLYCETGRSAKPQIWMPNAANNPLSNVDRDGHEATWGG